MTAILGVDPGLSGALALVRSGQLVRVDDMPCEAIGGTGTVKRRVGAAELAVLIRQIRAEHDDLLVVLEKVSAGSGQGVSSVFSLGDTYGAIRGVLQALGLRIELVTPASWKGAMRLGKDKDVSRTIAMQRWPDKAELFRRVKDHNRADAANLAAYGWQQFA